MKKSLKNKKLKRDYDQIVIDNFLVGVVGEVGIISKDDHGEVVVCGHAYRYYSCYRDYYKYYNENKG